MQVEHMPARDVGSAAVRGFTLVEVMITLAILFGALAVAFEALAGLTGASQSIDRKNELVTESVTVMNSLTNDVSLSGWAIYDCTSADFAGSYAQDRKLRYYPYVIQQAPTDAAAAARLAATTDPGGGLQDVSPTWFKTKTANWFVRANSQVDLGRYNPRLDLPPQLGQPADFSTNYTGTIFASEALRQKACNASFYARSQELVFLRACVGGWPAKPGVDTTPILRFPGGDWTSRTRDAGGGVMVKDNHVPLGVIRMSEWQLGDTNPASAAALDVRNPTSWYWNRPTAPAGLTQVPVAVNLGAMLSPQADPGNLVQIRWESMLNPSLYYFDMLVADPHPVIEFPTTSAGIARIKARQLREYCYLLLPSDSGAGRLVRAHTEIANLSVVSGRAAWVGDCISKGVDPTDRPISLVVDQVLTDNCMRVVFDTARTVTDGSLQPNQIRVTLYLAKGTTRQDEAPITHVASTVLTMRVLNSSVDNDSVATVLGTLAPGFAR